MFAHVVLLFAVNLMEASSTAPSALTCFFRRTPRARRLTLGYNLTSASRLKTPPFRPFDIPHFEGYGCRLFC
jgi:hypothetical protein